MDIAAGVDIVGPGSTPQSTDRQEDDVTGSGTHGGGITGVGQVALHVKDAGRHRLLPRRARPAAAVRLRRARVLRRGGTRLYLQGGPEERWAPGSIIYFMVGDIAAAHEELVGRGVAFQGTPHMIHKHDDGVEEWLAFLDDGEGNTLALISQVAPPQA